MAKVTEDSVRAAIAKLNAAGDEASLRKIREELGGGSMSDISRINNSLKQREPEVPAPAFAIDATAIKSIQQQFERGIAQALADLEGKFRVAQDNASLLTEHSAKLESQLASTSENLSAATVRTQQLQGQLDERLREMEKVRVDAANAVREADARVLRERDQIELLRRELVTAELRLASVPHIEKSLLAAEQRANASRDEAVRFQQEAAVAVAESNAWKDRLDDAAQREFKKDSQIQRLEESQSASFETERKLRDKVDALSSMAAAYKARDAVQQARAKKNADGAAGCVVMATVGSTSDAA